MYGLDVSDSRTASEKAAQLSEAESQGRRTGPAVGKSGCSDRSGSIIAWSIAGKVRACT